LPRIETKTTPILNSRLISSKKSDPVVYNVEKTLRNLLYKQSLDMDKMGKRITEMKKDIKRLRGD